MPEYQVGFLNHGPAKFTFVGPDRAPVEVNSLTQCLEIAGVIHNTGLPNYAWARIPLTCDLNLDEWERGLRDYPHQMSIQYLKLGFPLSLSMLATFRLLLSKTTIQPVSFLMQFRHIIRPSA